MEFIKHTITDGRKIVFEIKKIGHNQATIIVHMPFFEMLNNPDNRKMLKDELLSGIVQELRKD